MQGYYCGAGNVVQSRDVLERQLITFAQRQPRPSSLVMLISTKFICRVTSSMPSQQQSLLNFQIAHYRCAWDSVLGAVEPEYRMMTS